MTGASEPTVGRGTEFRVLGPLDVLHHGEVLDLGPFKQRSLLALLLINADRVVTTDRILEELWGDDTQGKEKALWVYISHLRSILEPERERRAVGKVIERLDYGYRLNVGSAQLDSRVFEDRLVRAHETVDDPLARAELIAESLELWRGSAYEDFQYESFAMAEAERLNEMRANAFEDRVAAVLERETGSRLVPQIENHLSRHPLRERAVAQLMVALYRSGRSPDALRTYSRFRRYLGEELGIEPSPELAALEERILLHDPQLQLPGTPSQGSFEGEVSNPYKGLASFEAEDADRFHGRTRLVAEVIRKMSGDDTLVALVGASGSGKSSVVAAGVVPALRNGAVAGSDSWPIVTIVPGANPFAELEAGLNRVAIEGAADLMGVLRAGRAGMLRAALRALSEGTDRLVLIIDQLEELFTLASPDDRAAFLDGLCEVAGDPYRRVLVVVMLRADFYDRALEHQEFAGLVGRGVVNVTPLSLEELEEAVEIPAKHVGVEVDSALMAQLVVDVVGKPGALPLLQHALMELFERRDGRRMTLASYDAMGRVGGTIASRAEDIYREIPPAEQEATRQIFLRLVTVSATNEWTRRRVHGSELLSLDVPAVTIHGVIDAFSRHRLITFDMDRVTRGAVVEVVHEALLTQWPRLTNWIIEAGDDIARQSRLAAATTEWVNADRSGDYLFTGSRLAEYSAWTETSTLLLTMDQRAFLDGAVAEERELEAQESQRLAREGKLGRKARRRTTALVLALMVIAGIAGVAVVNALDRAPVIAVVYSGNETPTGQAIAAAIETIRSDLGVDVVPIIPPFVSFESQITEAIDAGAELVVVDGQFEGSAFRSAERYPDLRWVVLQHTSSGTGFDVAQGAFLMGVAAAGESTTGKVGFVGLHQNPESEALRAGFEAGVREHRPSVEVLASYATATPWLDGDPDTAVQAAAGQLYDAGADIVFNAAQSPGVVAAAKGYKAATADHVYSIGSFTDEYLDVGPQDRDFVLTSLVKQYDEIIVAIVSDWIDDGELEDRSQWTLAEGAMTYSSLGDELADRVKRDIDRLRADVISGVVSVPGAPKGVLVSTEPAADIVEVTVSFDGSTCSYDGPQDVPIGSTLDITFLNGTSGDAKLEIGDDRLVTILAPTDAPGHGFYVLLEDEAPLMCASVDGGVNIAADRGPSHVPTPTDIDVVVSIQAEACEVEVLSSISDGDLVGFWIESADGVSGGAYSWLPADAGQVLTDPAFRPVFSDATRRWRWEEQVDGQPTFYARTFSAGDWAVGCWSQTTTDDLQIAINRYQVGAVIQVIAR